MPQPEPEPKPGRARLYLILAGCGSAGVAIISIIAGTASHAPLGWFVGAFWAVVSGLSFWSSRNAA
jgi:hypothetical protein